MAFTHRHLYVRLNGGIGGTSGSPVDKWSTGFRVAIPGQDIQLATPALQTFANAVHAAAITLHGQALTLAGSNCNFLYVTAARVGVDGKYDPTGQLTVVSTGAPQAGSGTPGLPWGSCLSVGFRTAAPRGYASNGRFYYPMLAGTIVTGTGRVTNTTVMNRLTNIKAFLNSVNTAANVYDPGACVCVMSKVGAGTTQRVISLRGDERVDNIERRENDQASNYQTLAL